MLAGTLAAFTRLAVTLAVPLTMLTPHHIVFTASLARVAAIAASAAAFLTIARRIIRAIRHIVRTIRSIRRRKINIFTHLISNKMREILLL